MVMTEGMLLVSTDAGSNLEEVGVARLEAWGSWRACHIHCLLLEGEGRGEGRGGRGGGRERGGEGRGERGGGRGPEGRGGLGHCTAHHHNKY